MRTTFYNLIINEEGYKDFYAKSKDLTVTVFRPIGSQTREADGSSELVTSANATHIDNNDGTFSTATSNMTHRPSYELFQVQRSGEDFDAYYETFNIMFLPEAMKDNVLEVFVKAASSLAGLDIAHSADGSYEFTTDSTKSLGNAATTGFFPNDNGVYYQNRISFVVETAQIESRAAHCVKFRFSAKIGSQDEFKIYAVEINSSGLIFEGETDA